MRISIVTISFNQVAFLEQTILSVLNQDHPDVEYIVVDPGSTDGSLEIIERYRDRIDKVVLAPDAGPADGLNKGFELVTGEILGFVNSDDAILPGALSRIAMAFERFAQTDVISGHAVVVDGEGREIRRIFSDRFNMTFAAYGACILVQPSTFFRASIFRRSGGFNIDNRSNWDAELFIEMALCNARFKTIPSMLSMYRVHSESITGSARLNDAHALHRARMFTKITHRQKKRSDRFKGLLFSYLRKALNPKDTFERIVRGPIFGASK